MTFMCDFFTYSAMGGLFTRRDYAHMFNCYSRGILRGICEEGFLDKST